MGSFDPSILLAVLWFVLGFWGWWIIYKKTAFSGGQKAFTILFGVFLVPLGICTLIAGAIIPRQKMCPYCRSNIDAKARVCLRCGRDQP